MYPISPAFLEALSTAGADNRTITWYGSMTTENGTVYDINTSIIDSGSGILTNSCGLPFAGGAYSASLEVQLRLSGVDPRTLKNAKIVLWVRLSYNEPITAATTWGSLKKFSWGDLRTVTWGGDSRTVYTDIPMGVFYVTEAKRVLYSIRIEAYDNMVKFDTDLPGMDSTSRSAYEWLKWVCNACGVELGMTAAQVKALPNGSRSFVYADVDKAVKTYRNLLGKLAAALGAIAVIDRRGALVLARAGNQSAMEISPSDRFSSEYEDTQSRYTGLWAQYKAQAMQEYYKNVSALEDTGLVMDLGANPFLQISNSSSRSGAIQAIIDGFTELTFTPFTAAIPCHPELDLLDVIAFSGGHAPENCHGPITSITRTINGGVTIQCAVPEEQVSPTRETTQVDGLSGSTGTTYASTDFWIQIASYPAAETQITEDTITTELTVNCTVDNTTMQIAWTGAYTLDAAATVTAKVLVDDEEIYSAADDQAAGNHVLNVTTGYSVSTQGERVIKVILREDVIE